MTRQYVVAGSLWLRGFSQLFVEVSVSSHDGVLALVLPSREGNNFWNTSISTSTVCPGESSFKYHTVPPIGSGILNVWGHHLVSKRKKPSISFSKYRIKHLTFLAPETSPNSEAEDGLSAQVGTLHLPRKPWKAEHTWYMSYDIFTYIVRWQKWG
jgi:hypothetical protein